MRLHPFGSARTSATHGRGRTVWSNQRRQIVVRAGQTTVYESLTLVSFPSDTIEDVCTRIVDGLWSLQYLAAGPICGCAGPLSAFALGKVAGAQQQQQQQQRFSHAVLFRYGTEAALAAFQRAPRVAPMLDGTGAPEAQELATINFQGSVPNELESVFRRGEEWEAGYELVAGLDLQAGQSEQDALEFLSLLQQLAASSAFGAVQASWGPCLGAVHSQRRQQEGSAGGSAGGGSADGPLVAPAWVLLVRFLDREALRRFLGCAPVAALLEGDARCPLRALWHGALEVAPTEASSSTPQKRGGLL